MREKEFNLKSINTNLKEKEFNLKLINTNLTSYGLATVDGAYITSDLLERLAREIVKDCENTLLDISISITTSRKPKTELVLSNSLQSLDKSILGSAFVKKSKEENNNEANSID